MKVTGAMGRQKQDNPQKWHGGGHRQLLSSYLDEPTLVLSCANFLVTTGSMYIIKDIQLE